MANGNNTNRMGSNTYNRFKSFAGATTLAEKIIYVVFAALFVAMIIYWLIYLYNTYKKNKKYYALITQYSPINPSNIYKVQKIPYSQVGNQITVSYWLKINNVDSTRVTDSKNILLIYNENEDDFIQFKLGDGTNITNFSFTIQTTNGSENCNIENVPLYTWVNLVYVINNRIVDVYANGKLLKSCVMQGIPFYVLKNYSVQIGSKTRNDDIDCELFMVQYYGRALMANEIYGLYNDKPNPAVLSKLI
jgi:hypothetical protein